MNSEPTPYEQGLIHVIHRGRTMEFKKVIQSKKSRSSGKVTQTTKIRCQLCSRVMPMDATFIQQHIEITHPVEETPCPS